MHLRSPAKLNLGLRILGRRQDGYHLLESFFWPLSLHDDLVLTADARRNFAAIWAPDALKISTAIPGGEENLVIKTLRLFSEVSDSLVLSKRIPMGAGLGGGSSNAGTLLAHLAKERQLSPQRELALAEGLGADVPFFLDSRPAWVSGVGERRHYFDAGKTPTNWLSSLRFLLVIPPFSCGTREVFATYKNLNRPFSAPRQSTLPEKLSEETFFQLAQDGENDLFEPAATLFPFLRQVIDALKSTSPLFCGMSGSGSTCYAAYESPIALEKRAKGLSAFFRSTHCASTTVATHGAIFTN